MLYFSFKLFEDTETAEIKPDADETLIGSGTFIWPHCLQLSIMLHSSREELIGPHRK